MAETGTAIVTGAGQGVGAACADALRDGGTGRFLLVDRDGDALKEAADRLRRSGADVRALVADLQDADAIMPSVQRALDGGVPVIAYERQIEDPAVTYVAFDPVEVGRIQARAVTQVTPTGDCVIVKSSPTDPYTTCVAQGQREIIEPMIAAGDIEVIAEQFTDGWIPRTRSATWSRS